MMRLFKLLGVVFLLFIFSGCEKKDPTTLTSVHWDRDMCERCKMVVSDRHHAVQVINILTRRSYMFDDIGCAVLWFDDEKIEWSSKAKIWITDVSTGEWIDAHKALYSTNNITPMAYGFAAHKSKDSVKKDEEIVNFEEMSRRVFKIEEKNNARRY